MCQHVFRLGNLKRHLLYIEAANVDKKPDIEKLKKMLLPTKDIKKLDIVKFKAIGFMVISGGSWVYAIKGLTSCNFKF
ncbi:MAG TPA: hypothetical protein EYG82_08255 [Sulfurovum sp.]|nr:hypothetical protein [Sulfurovum sp.]